MLGSTRNSVIEQEQRLTAPYINLAMAYRHKGNEKLAEENLLKALAIDQAQPVANNELGILYRKQGRFDDAKKVYINALSEYPDYLPVIKNLGILCDIYMRDPHCALEQFEKYQQHVPEDKTVKVWIADLKTRIYVNRSNESIRYYMCCIDYVIQPGGGRGQGAVRYFDYR